MWFYCLLEITIYFALFCRVLTFGVYLNSSFVVLLLIFHLLMFVVARHGIIYGPCFNLPFRYYDVHVFYSGLEIFAWFSSETGCDSWFFLHLLSQKVSLKKSIHKSCLKSLNMNIALSCLRLSLRPMSPFFFFLWFCCLLEITFYFAFIESVPESATYVWPLFLPCGLVAC